MAFPSRRSPLCQPVPVWECLNDTTFGVRCQEKLFPVCCRCPPFIGKPFAFDSLNYSRWDAICQQLFLNFSNFFANKAFFHVFATFVIKYRPGFRFLSRFRSVSPILPRINAPFWLYGGMVYIISPVPACPRPLCSSFSLISPIYRSESIHFSPFHNIFTILPLHTTLTQISSKTSLFSYKT